jgi:predicted ATPase/class 3 adenylate cyclase
MHSSQPSGTVTLVFTDIEGSTRLLEELGTEAHREALAEHRRVVREACARFSGYEVDYEGDAFFYAFASASDAVAAVSELMAGLESGPIRIRVGVHTGEPVLDPPKYVGMDVHRAARLMASAHGRQVVVSASTAALVMPSNDQLQGWVLRDLGEHRFKDLGAAERVFQLGEGEFPPIRSLYRNNLPVPATPFLGRERELQEVVERLTDPAIRLLTLTGPGGTGKTRLALQAVAEASDGFPDGVWWVPLAPLRDPALVLSSVAQALQVQEEPGRELAETLAARLAGKRLLLLLDNIEHLLPNAGSAVAALRDLGGGVVAVTSRERLQLQGEDVYPVPPLAAAEAVELFLARARSAGVELEPSLVVEELCARLDDLPLALELAAARTVVFSPEQLLERLGQRLDLLKGARDADPRQQTLRATVEWSYDLLDAEEQRVLRALSVFAGGCTYDAAEQVAGADDDTLQSLLDKSLVRRRDTDVGPRYWMLETIREHAAGELRAAGEERPVRLVHAQFYVTLLLAIWRRVRMYETEALSVVREELANARSGLAFALDEADAGLAARYVWGLCIPWLTLGHNREAMRAVDRYLALDHEHASAAERFWGRGGASEVLRFSGESERAGVLKRELLEVLEAGVDLALEGHEAGPMLAPLLTDLASIELELGRLDAAREFALRGLEERRRDGRGFGIAHALYAVAAVEVASGNLEADEPASSRPWRSWRPRGCRRQSALGSSSRGSTWPRGTPLVRALGLSQPRALPFWSPMSSSAGTRSTSERGSQARRAIMPWRPGSSERPTACWRSRGRRSTPRRRKRASDSWRSRLRRSARSGSATVTTKGGRWTWRTLSSSSGRGSPARGRTPRLIRRWRLPSQTCARGSRSSNARASCGASPPRSIPTSRSPRSSTAR